MRLPNSVETIQHIGGRSLYIPPGGWTAESFIEHGARMVQTMARTAKIMQRKAAPMFIELSRKIFRSQIHRIIRRAEQSRQHFRLGIRSLPESIVLDFPQEEALWAEAIDYVMQSEGIQVVTQMVPPIQSVMAQGYSKTNILLGQRSDAQVNAEITRQTRDIAKDVVGINETTRKNILNAVKDGVAQNKTVPELADYIEERTGKIFGNRAVTIARTELNRAWTRGAAISFEQSDAITKVSVIGCERREASSPHYKGQSTCNYPSLPIAELDAFLEVGFHPNHSGTLVPSGFKSDSEMDSR